MQSRYPAASASSASSAVAVSSAPTPEQCPKSPLRYIAINDISFDISQHEGRKCGRSISGSGAVPDPDIEAGALTRTSWDGSAAEGEGAADLSAVVACSSRATSST